MITFKTVSEEQEPKGMTMDEREIKFTLYRFYVKIKSEEEVDDVLGFEWLEEAGFSYEGNKALYNKAKAALGDMEKMGWIESTRRKKGRKGRPGQYWVFTNEGHQGIGDLYEENREDRALEIRLNNTDKAIRINMPCEREVWREITRMGRAGDIVLYVKWDRDVSE